MVSMPCVKVKWLRVTATLLLAATFVQTAAALSSSYENDDRELAICSDSSAWGSSSALQQSTQKHSSSIVIKREDIFFSRLEVSRWPLNETGDRFDAVHLLACTTTAHRPYASRAPPVSRA
jgi:hypothetical protein